MTLDFTVPGKVKITMIDYVKDILLLFSKHDKSNSTANMPAAEHLVKVNTQSTPLTQKTATIFHNFGAKCLFLTKRARPNISTAVAFLTTHVKGPDKDDWRKLVQMICYLCRTTSLPLILRAASVPVPKWWVDGSYTTHPNMHSCNRGCYATDIVIIVRLAIVAAMQLLLSSIKSQYPLYCILCYIATLVAACPLERACQ
jgi:hypothetical protein